MSRVSRRKFIRNATATGAILSQRRVFSVPAATAPDSDWSAYKMFYKRAASTWPDALPVGNGRLGAMVFGIPGLERIQLNEESIWDGERRDRDNPKAGTAVPEIRKLLLAGKVHDAERMATEDMFSIPRRMPCYQTLGDLHLNFGAVDGVSDYRLELDLDRAVTTTTYSLNGVQYKREVFSSAPDQVIVVRISASAQSKVSFRATMDRPGDHASGVMGTNGLAMKGEALPVNDNPGLPVKERQTGVRFLTHLRALAEGGSVSTTSDTKQLIVTNANAVTLLIDCATSFRYPAGEEVMAAAVERNLAAAAKRSHTNLLSRHIADYQAIFRRATFELGPDAKANVPTDERIKAIKAGSDDPGMLPLYFQYGRYLLISSSRPGTLAANLQGIWNEAVDPPWGSKYTVNINAQMNYWIAERTNLADLHGPLFDLIDSTKGPGERVAKSYYGAGGLVVHHNTDIWGDAGPIDTLGGGIWAMGAAWLATHLWDHYQYSGDMDFLRTRAYPRLRDVSVFLLDYLTPSPDGYLVTGPSCSPENAYRLPDGTKANLCMAPTTDIAITRALFQQTTAAAKLLGVDAPLCTRMEAAAAKLPPYKIGHNGGLQEWYEDYAETEPGHRHISHLWGLYPNDGITVRSTPELAKACRATLDLRLAAGGGSTGWSRAWVINCFARLEDGDRCHQQLMELLKLSTRENLFDVCGIKANSVYQIDGNLGAPAGMAEMLLQSHGDVVRLLPALPSAWPNGRFTGLRARGGLTIDLAWRGGKAESATLKASLNGDVTLAVPAGQHIAGIADARHRTALTSAETGFYKLKMTRGETYTLKFN